MAAWLRVLAALAFFGQVTSTVAASVADPLRLDRSVVEPLAQWVQLELDPAADGFSGRARMDLRVHAPTSSLRLHAEDLDLEAITLFDETGKEATPLTAKAGELGTVALSAPETMAPGFYQLQTDFRGRYRRDGVGLYKSFHQDRPYLFTQMEARFARLAFPCWDEPAFKIPWRITVTVPSAYSAFSNGAVAIETEAGGWKTIEFGRTPPMPSYLVALAVGEFETRPVPGLSVPGRVIVPPGQIDLAAGLTGESAGILSALETYFGVPCPYPKLDQIAVPEFTFGAMENAGLIAYRDTIILADPGNTSFDQRRWRANTVAHELAHLWFGDLVTMEWWDDLWLNESFASWMAARIVDRLHPEMRMRLASLQGAHEAMEIDALPSTRPIRRSISAAEDPMMLADTLSYEKGQAVLEMIESWIGPETFRAAMRVYFERHRWGNTRADDLWDAFETAGGSGTAAIAAGFITQPGIPIVTVELAGGDRVRLRQRRFMPSGAPVLHGSADQTWHVPVVLRYPRGDDIEERRMLLTKAEETLSLSGIDAAAWLHPNKEAAGYFRWNLPSRMQSWLSGHASETLAPKERLELLDNARALLDAGETSGGDYLRLLAGLASDPVPEVALAVAAGIQEVRAIFLDTSDRELYAGFCHRVLRPVLDRIGLLPQADESGAIAPLRARLLGILGGEPADAAVLAEAVELAGAAIRNPAAVDAALAPTALRIAARHGDAALYDAVERAYRTAREPNHRSMFLRTLGSFADRSLLDRALRFTLGPEVVSTDTLMIPWQVARENEEQRAFALDWMMANYDALVAKIPSFHAGWLIRLAEGPDAALFERARDFLLAPERTSDLAKKNAAEVGDNVALQAALRQRERAAVLEFLQSHAQVPGDAKQAVTKTSGSEVMGQTETLACVALKRSD